MLFPHGSTYQKITDINITQHGIQKMLENLNSHKATGLDDICPPFLKTVASNIAPILMIVYKKSYNTGQLPDGWKSANVVPVFKKGNTSLAANYRPISLTCVSCKLMEHIITSNMMWHASTHNILYHLQHGFRDKGSCETQLLEFQNDIVTNMNNGKQTEVIVMDFAKAFDKVGHRRLIEKMKYYGVGGKTNKWIKDLIAGRNQRVVLDGEKSYNQARVHVQGGGPRGLAPPPPLEIKKQKKVIRANFKLFHLYLATFFVKISFSQLFYELGQIEKQKKKRLSDFEPLRILEHAPVNADVLSGVIKLFQVCILSLITDP